MLLMGCREQLSCGRGQKPAAHHPAIPGACFPGGGTHVQGMPRLLRVQAEDLSHWGRKGRRRRAETAVGEACAEVLTPGASGCDLLRKRGHGRCNQIR